MSNNDSGLYFNTLGRTDFSPVACFVYDQTLNGGTGSYRQLKSTDFSLTITSGINITGVVSIDDYIQISGFSLGQRTVWSSGGYVNNLIVNSGSCKLIHLEGYSDNISGGFIQIFDTTGVISDNSIPVATKYVKANDNFVFDFGDIGLPLNSGCFVCNSISGQIKLIGAANCFFTAIIV